MYGDFTDGTWDFVRCLRADGTYYGTSGNCRKGTKTGPKQQGKFLGGGLEGKVYDIGRGRVLKIANGADPNLEAQRIASEAELAPRIIASGSMKKDPKQRKYQVIDRVVTEDVPGIGQPGRPSIPLEELSEQDRIREKRSYLAALELNALGVEHGDLHGGNLKWDTGRDRPVLLDFDNAQIDKKRAKTESQSLLNSIGIRLEESGYYDEADEVFSVAQSRGKNFFERARDVIEEQFPEG